MRKNSGHSELCFDVLFDILLNISVKTLGKFKSVCKSWSSLISSSLFQEEHYNRRSQQNPLLLITQRDYRILSSHNPLSRHNSVLHLTTLGNKEERKFSKTAPFTWRLFTAQSCRGIVCLASVFRNRLCLTNPSTEEMLVLPESQGPNDCCIGMGFTTLTKRFKVVRFYYGYNEKKTGCEVFTLGTNFWRRGMNPPPFPTMDFAPFVNGALHLLPQIRMDPEAEFVSAFILEDEKFRKIMFPKINNLLEKEDVYFKIRLSDLGGTLCLTFIFPSRLELWLLKDYYNEEWMKGYTICTYPLMDNFSYDCKTYPLAIMGDGSIMLSISWATETKLLRYDPNVRVATLTLCLEFTSSATYYVESFFPLGTR